MLNFVIMKTKKSIYIILVLILIFIAYFFYNAIQKKRDTEQLTPTEYLEKHT